MAEAHALGASEVLSTALETRPVDLDTILDRKQLRMAIPYSPIYYSYDGEKFIGFAVEMARELEGRFPAMKSCLRCWMAKRISRRRTLP